MPCHRDSGARRHRYAAGVRLVGDDEANAAQGLISWTAPLAQSLLGREAGEPVPFQGVEAETVSIEP